MSVNIHGKEYFTVAERLSELNTKVEGNYTLTTEMVYFKDGMVVFKATLQVEENTFTGHAMEKEDASMINKTSFVECAETSAIGRALASAGFLGSEFASADEVATAIKNQGDNPVQNTSKGDDFATPNQVSYIKKLCTQNGIPEDKYPLEEMTKQEASDIIQVIMETKTVGGSQ